MGLEVLSAGDIAAQTASVILGIDLGTTYSLAATMQNGAPVMIRDPSGDARVPSVIGFQPDGTVTVGKSAKQHILADPEHTVYSVKRLIGKTMAELAAELPYVPYQVVERELPGERRVLHVKIGDRELTPEELSAMVLREVVARATERLGRPVEKAVITVPAYFDESQRQATRDAGRLAGLDVIRIVNEPTAAALAYGLVERRNGLVAVYDFGGGTFDCSILKLADGVFQVLSTHGDTHLGGDDIDRALMTRIEEEIRAKGLLAQIDLGTRQHIRDACERAKIELSLANEAALRIRVPGSGLDYSRTIGRAEFDALIAPLVERTLASCRHALRDAGVEPGQIDEVVLVGGSSRIPMVRREVQRLFGRVPHCELNPDEVVAMGAAIQASILAGQLRQILLLDITPLSLGIETMGGAVSRLIARNSTIPAQATERFTTFVDNQTGVDIHVVQGERELANDCRSLGRFKLGGIPPMPAGLPQIDVTFLIDANGMLQVTARELRSGRAASIEVQPSHGLSRADVEQMIRSSIEAAQLDFRARRLIELGNKADANLRHTEKGLHTAGERLDADQRGAIERAVHRVRSARDSGDPDRLQEALDELDAATLPLAELLINSVVKAEVAGKKVGEI